MSDYTVVYFSGIKRGFSVPSVLADFSIFGIDIEIKFYGAIIAFGFLLAVLFGGRMAYKWKMSLDKMVDVLIYGTIFAIIGARLYYVFSKWDYYGAHLSEIPQIWEGGLAIYGGIIGGLVAAYFVCKIRKMNYWNLLDIATMSLLIGQGIGRWGNFTNQEAFGVNTDLPWGMWSEKVAEDITRNQALYAEKGFSVDPNLPVHPTFLYESIWCLLGFFVLYLICCKARKFSGQVALCYGIWYGIERTVVEGLRTDSLYIAGTTIRVSQALSAALVVVCTALLIVLLIKNKKNPKPIDGIDFFLEEQLKAEKEAKNNAKEKIAKKEESAENEEVISDVQNN
ncbi:MAG: prolipoprotein diacylglyceryl transferase [Clostridia bacterium]|nr:prolipoprotein diacylglyceryl transferase [Clostridia bacterium]